MDKMTNHRWTHECRKGSGRKDPPWVLNFDIFLSNFLTKKVVFLVSSRQNEISQTFGPPLWKNLFGYPGKIHY